MNALLFNCTLVIYCVATVTYLAYLLKPGSRGELRDALSELFAA